MKKSLKKYLWSWIVVGVLSVVFIVLGETVGFAPHHKLAQDPTNIEKITKLDLPDIISVESSDNLGRGQSCWDCFEHISHFEGKLSDDCVRQLESLCVSDTVHWRKNENAGYYEYIDDAWNEGGDYSISCRIYEDYSYVEYYVDETEGLAVTLIGYALISGAVLILVIWGIIWGILLLLNKIFKGKMLD